MPLSPGTRLGHYDLREGSPWGFGSSAFANPKSSTLTVPSSRTFGRAYG